MCEVVETWEYSNAPGIPNATRFLQSASHHVDVLDAASGLLNNRGIFDALTRAETGRASLLGTPAHAHGHTGDD